VKATWLVSVVVGIGEAISVPGYTLYLFFPSRICNLLRSERGIAGSLFLWFLHSRLVDINIAFYIPDIIHAYNKSDLLGREKAFTNPRRLPHSEQP
jgi:hypothetical protein